jgi:glycosyltransferase involved in cell wall biosynthesis
VDGRRDHDRIVDVTMAIQAFTPIVGGGELQLERLLRPLAERGVRARVVTRGVPDAPRHELVAGSDVRRTAVAGESPRASLVYVASALASIAARRRATDVVHAHGALSPATIALGATYLAVPAVVTPLGAGAPGDLRRVRAKPGGELRLRALVRRAHFVALSDEIAAELRALGVPGERVHEIPNGVDSATYHVPTGEERARARTALGVDADHCCFVFVGRLHPVKRVDVVIDALAGVEGANLVVVGDGPERAALERRAHEAGVAAHVRFAGSTPHVVPFLHAADAFVLPSAAEGMSNALVEAMACGLPCLVTSAIGGVAALVGEDRGVLVPAGDVGAWRAAMTVTVAGDARRHELGEAAARFVQSSLTLDRTADRLAALYRSLARR